MLKLADLAMRPDFQIGPLSVSPARRLVEGPAGKAQVEPLVMQVFLLLLDARGRVVTRKEIFDQVWGGIMVGDDSVNRAVAAVRRIASETAPGVFAIETIPRTGYRLTGEGLDDPAGTVTPSTSRAGISRRTLAVGGLAAAGLLGAGALTWWQAQSREEREFDELMARGRQALLYGDAPTQAEQYFRTAAAMRPDNAAAQGSLALLAVRADLGDRGQAGTALQEAQRMASAALAIDRNEPHARLAMITIQRSMLDFASTEDRLREVLATAPDNVMAMRNLWNVMQCVGRSREALALVERALAVAPYAAGNHFPRAQLLWILGRSAEADRVIDQAMQSWPSHRFVRFARFTIFAHTGRPRAALAMLDSKATAPQHYSPEAIALWRVSLTAFDQRTRATIDAARRANIEAAKRDLRLASQAILALAELGDVDAAFELTNTLFVVPPDASRRPRRSGLPVRSTAWRFAPWLFTPPLAPLRADPRFETLCDEIGLTDYWTRRNVKPDYQLGIA